MSTYRGENGIPVLVIAGDPANPVAGQIWFNTSTNTFRVYNGSATTTITQS